MNDPLRFEWQSTPACWSCYYDPEGPSGMGKTKEEALEDLWDSCDDEHRADMLLGAIVAAIENPNPAGLRATGVQGLERGPALTGSGPSGLVGLGPAIERCKGWYQTTNGPRQCPQTSDHSGLCGDWNASHQECLNRR